MLYWALIISCIAVVGYFAYKYCRYLAISRSEVNCQNCGYPEHPHKSPYDLRTRCSECGMTWTAAEKRNDMRRRVSALLTVLSLVMTIWAIVAASRQDSFIRVIPDWMLVRIAPTQPSDGWRYVASPVPRLLEEVGTRRVNGELNASASSVFAMRTLHRLARDGNLVHMSQRSSDDHATFIRVAGCRYFSMLGNIRVRVSKTDGFVLLDTPCRGGPGRGIMNTSRTVDLPQELIRNGSLAIQFEILDATSADDVLADRVMILSYE